MTTSPPSLSRRSLLKRGLLGGGLLLLGGAGFLASRGSRKVPLPPEGLRVLGETEYAVMHALALRLITPLPGAPTVEQVRVAFIADGILARTDAGVQQELKQLIGLFENGLSGFLFGGRTRPFTQLDGAEQDQVLREWQDSAITLRRTGYQALRTVLMSAYYASPVTWASVGYSGPPEGFHQPDAPVWRGGGTPRPDGNGVFHAPEPEPEPAETKQGEAQP